MHNNFAAEEIESEIRSAEIELSKFDIRAFRMWEGIRVTPTQWSQKQYEGVGNFWVVGLLGKRCLYFNSVEGGWGWGKYSHWGEISEYHWEQLEINHVVFQTLFAIENGG